MYFKRHTKSTENPQIAPKIAASFEKSTIAYQQEVDKLPAEKHAAAGQNFPPAGQALQEERRPLLEEFAKGNATRFMGTPPPFRWLINGCLQQGEVGCVCGPGSCGKGWMMLDLMRAFAMNSSSPSGGVWLDTWRINPELQGNCLYLSAEDTPLVIHHRLHKIFDRLPLSEDEKEAALSRIYALGVYGQVQLSKFDAKDNSISKTQAFHDLKKIIVENHIKLAVLDTLARFYSGLHNSNEQMAAFVGMLEELAKETDCAILVTHHTRKTNADMAKDQDALNSALSATSATGAQELTGTMRWVMQVAMLSSSYAGKIINSEAAKEPSGTFIAVRIAKQNNAARQQDHFFGRTKSGLLEKVEAKKLQEKAHTLEEKTNLLIEAIEKHAREKGRPFSKSTAVLKAQIAATTNGKKELVDLALSTEKIIERRQKGKRGGGIILCPTTPDFCTALSNPENQENFCSGCPLKDENPEKP